MRSIIVLALALVISVPAVAGEAPPPDQILKAVLDLNEQQLQDLHRLRETRRAAVTDAAGRLEGLRMQLEATLNAPAPDPAAVGSLVISVRAVEREVAQHQETFRTAFFGILSEEQRQRVESFKFIRGAFLGGTALDELGL